MAYVKGYPGKDSKENVLRHLFLMIIVAAVMVGLMLYFSDDWKSEMVTIMGIGGFCVALIAFVSSRIDPMALNMILRRSQFEADIKADRAIADILGTLSDRCYVFNYLVLELFRIENLVVSPYGIFVIARVRKKGELVVEKETLFAGAKTLETTTSNLWRVCHLLNIVIKKGFDLDIMPKPLLITDPDYSSSIGSSDGVDILPRENLSAAIEEENSDLIGKESVESIASFILKRYCR